MECRVLRPALAGVALLLALAPAASPGQSDVEARLQRVERLLDGGALVQMLQDLEALRDEVQALRGELEEQSHAVSQLKQRQRDLYLDLDQRLLRIQEAGVGATNASAEAGGGEAPSPAAAEPASTAQGQAGAAEPRSDGASVRVAAVAPSEAAGGGADPAATDPVKEQQDYQAAFNLLKAGRYDDAAKALRAFLGAYPRGEFVDNARYWLGETFYVTRRFEAALQEFSGLIGQFPQSPKLTHAMLKVGYIHHELGRPEQAKQVLGALIERHPESTAAGLARKRLKRLQSE